MPDVIELIYIAAGALILDLQPADEMNTQRSSFSFPSSHCYVSKLTVHRGDFKLHKYPATLKRNIPTCFLLFPNPQKLLMITPVLSNTKRCTSEEKLNWKDNGCNVWKLKAISSTYFILINYCRNNRIFSPGPSLSPWQVSGKTDVFISLSFSNIINLSCPTIELISFKKILYSVNKIWLSIKYNTMIFFL